MVAVTSGDLIPINDNNGSGQYVVGRNSARDIRVGLVGPTFLPGADGFTPRAGVLMRTGDGSDLKVNPQVTPDQTVIVKKGVGIVPRTGQGAYLFVNEADQTVPLPAASGVNSRYDSICASAYDKGAFGSDASHGPEFIVVSGGVAGSPSPPATPAGMIKLADVLRATNDNLIAAGEITDKRNTTGVHSGYRTIGGGDTNADPGFVTGEGRFTSSRGPEIWNGFRWVRVGLEIYGSIASIPAELAVENSVVYHAALKRVIRYTSGAWDIPYDRTPGCDVEIAADLAIGTPTLVTNMTTVNTALVGISHAAGVWTVQITGWWNLTFSVRLSNTTVDKYAFIAGTGTGNVYGKDSTNGSANTQATCQKYLTAGSQFRCYAYSGAAANATHESAGDDITGLQATWLGA
jgi:hypothetical protein